MNMLSLINSSIEVNTHRHPLKYCYTIERKKYGTGWTCNKCSSSFSYDIPSFYCTYCDFDLCHICLGKYPLNEIKLAENNSSKNNFKFFINQNTIYPWQKQYCKHEHLLTFVQRQKNNCSWICDNCSNEFKNNISSFYCSLCDYDICSNYFNGYKNKNWLIKSPIKFVENSFTDDDDCDSCSNWRFCPNFYKEQELRKPIIYLYPEKSMNISVNLNIGDGKFTAIYPQFNEKNNTWTVRANKNGEIAIKDKKYPYLYYECDSNFPQETNEGFIVEDKNAINFLEEKLKILGLNDKEMTDFITFCLPILIKNKLSICTFQTQKFFNHFQLNIEPKPDTLIRIFLTIKKIDSPIQIKEQKLQTVERKGFIAVEWGGSNF